jgi:hypothetical protein
MNTYNTTAMNSKNQHAYFEKFIPTEKELDWALAQCPDLFEHFSDNPKVKVVQLEHNQDGEIRVWMAVGLVSALGGFDDFWQVASQNLFIATDLKTFESSDEGLELAFAQGRAWGWKIGRKEYASLNIRPNSDRIPPPAAKRVQNNDTGEIYPSVAATRSAFKKSGRWIKNAIANGILSFAA